MRLEKNTQKKLNISNIMIKSTKSNYGKKNC